MGTVKTKRIDPEDNYLPIANDSALERRVAEADLTYDAKSQEASLGNERLNRHRKAVSMIAGLWQDREVGPVDGIEYQDQLRAAW
jgi:hypothetical protein